MQKHSRPFRCKQDSCVKSFATKAHLQRHETTHGRTKTIICALCLAECAWDDPWCCRRIDHLQRHLLRKHKIKPSSDHSLIAQCLTTLQQQQDQLLQIADHMRVRGTHDLPESWKELMRLTAALRQCVDEGATGVPIIEAHKISDSGFPRNLRVFLGTTGEGTLDQLRSRSAQYVLHAQHEALLGAAAWQSHNIASGIAEYPQSGGGGPSTGQIMLALQNGAHAPEFIPSRATSILP